MSSRDAWASVPNLSGITSTEQEDSRSGDPSRFFGSPGASGVDAVTGRVLNVPRVSLWMAATPVSATGIAFAMPWDSEEYDTAGMWSAANQTRITSPVGGLYHLIAWMEWFQVAGGYRQMYFRKNGSGLYRQNVTPPIGPGATDDVGMDVYMALNAGDYVEVIAAQTSGGALSVNGATATNRINGFQATLASTFGSDNQ